MPIPRQTKIIGFWKGLLDEDGNMRDFNPNAGVTLNHGTLVSAPPATETPFGSARDYDGVADRITFGNIGNNIKTVSLIVKLDSDTNFLVDFDGTDNIDVNAGTIQANSISNAHIYVDGKITTTIQVGAFYHIVVTTDTALDASAFVLANIGASFGNGVFLQLIVWSVELSPNEVLELYNEMIDLTGK